MKRKNLFCLMIPAAAAGAVFFAGCAGKTGSGEVPAATEKPAVTEDTEAGKEPTEVTSSVEEVQVVRPHLLDSLFSAKAERIVPSDSSITLKPEADLSNVENTDQFYLDDIKKKLLVTNGFYVGINDHTDEFFEVYEGNRYSYVPNFVSVDSMLHTYHLYFMHLMKTTEKEELSVKLLELSNEMLQISNEQYEALKGTAWEDAARRNVGFFAVAAKLLDDSANVPAEVEAAVDEEIKLINEAGGIQASPLFGGDPGEDYSQYKPRGYYEGDEQLEKYFRAMMWYGRINFTSSDEELLKSSVLISLALENGPKDTWDRIYSVTSFFAGESDDLSYIDYIPAVKKSFADTTDLKALSEDTDGLEKFKTEVEGMKGPMINSVPSWDDGGATDRLVTNKGFRFMGQRFSVDGAIFTQLIYSKTGKNPNGDARMLPDALDVAAALGSEKAYELLEEQGNMEFEDYKENLDAQKSELAAAPASFWEGSLSNAWFKTAMPVLESKDDSYPFFMTNDAWDAKCVEGFLGSYTELKHDTVLYSKQVIAEMGGADIIERDDRGYVEPEPEVFENLSAMLKQTSDGLDSLGCLSDTDKENLLMLSDLSGDLADIAKKELTGGDISDDDYELIRSIGGTLEHFWADAVQEGDDYISTQERPAALVVDVATGDGTVLECATGGPSTAYVLVPVDGKLRIASGPVFSFYEFESDERMTDTDWRFGMGYAADFDEDYNYIEHERLDIEKPYWTLSYRDQ